MCLFWRNESKLKIDYPWKLLTLPKNLQEYVDNNQMTLHQSKFVQFRAMYLKEKCDGYPKPADYENFTKSIVLIYPNLKGVTTGHVS